MSSLLEQFTQTSHLAGGNAAFIEGLYEEYLKDKQSVTPEWQQYFSQISGKDNTDVAHSPIIAQVAKVARMNGKTGLPMAGTDDQYAKKQAGVFKLITAYRVRGHLVANLDPLGVMPKQAAPELDLAYHGLSPADLNTEFNTGSLAGPERLSLKAVISALQATYTNTIGIEFMHIPDITQRMWLSKRIENTKGDFGWQEEERKRILLKLTQAEGLERYLHTKYVGQKRFSLEGGDALIPMLDEVICRSSAQGMQEIVIGMAHRGRLNVLVNTMGKPPHQLFAEFEGKHDGPEDPAHSGDVKYHMGFSSDVATPSGPVHLALGFNPSHLEIIDPVIAGSVRARQQRREDEQRNQVMPILIHGDAAFSCQGVVLELLQMSQARGFHVGGTVHIVINNQVGFTTSRMDDARSTLYCTDAAKMVAAPIFHVNGDDPEAVLFCARLAVDFRNQFKRDVVIDLVCYRRHGHNEADEPAATQPLMYQNIRNRKTTRELYAQYLIQQAVINAEDAQALLDGYRQQLDSGRIVADLASNPLLPAIDWSRHLHATIEQSVDSSVKLPILKKLAQVISTIPDGFVLHPRVAKVYEDRVKMAAGDLAMDWGFAENLAYATLIEDGYKLRLVGQDSGRGTFFHRHAVLHDQKTGETRLPLHQLTKRPADVTIIDSLLSEEAVMAFEYGYATTDPNTLVIWEGQFGDFANGAQVVIDQFISSGEAKWGRLCGLTLFLPHGYEGQGPEHSSARLERFLQLCAFHNMQVCAPTTPAQMFHLIRRQMCRDVRKPLIIMSPKSMLRHRLSTSVFADLTKQSFQEMIPDTIVVEIKKAKRLVLCAGKVYYDLIEEAGKRDLQHVAIVRVEQLYPFPRQAVKEELARFSSVKEVVWCQEEPMNQGAWYQIQHHIRACLSARHTLFYAGRPRSPAPACGHFNTHVAEQAALLENALVAAIKDEVVLD